MTSKSTDEIIDSILETAKVVAVVGHSDKPNRASYQIGKYLREHGFTVYPINPTVDTIDGVQSYASLADVPEPIDVVDVFRRSEHFAGVAEEAIEVGAGAIWGQIGVVSARAYELAQEAGILFVMDRCIKVEHRLRSE